MGNRALIEALQTYLAKRAPGKRQHIFAQIVFTAPDVDRDYFIDAIGSLRGTAERVTLYASGNDRALHYSQFVHGAPRAGTAGDVIVKLAGLDTIDMSAVPADALGHSYFAANSGAIYDIFRILWRGDPPPQRCGMSSHAEEIRRSGARPGGRQYLGPDRSVAEARVAAHLESAQWVVDDRGRCAGRNGQMNLGTLALVQDKYDEARHSQSLEPIK